MDNGERRGDGAQEGENVVHWEKWKEGQGEVEEEHEEWQSL